MWFLYLLPAVSGSSTEDIDCNKFPYDLNPIACTQFKEFGAHFKKSYKDVVEKEKRFENFTKNLARLKVHREKYPQAQFSHLTPFFDKSKKEFLAYNGFWGHKKMNAKPLSKTELKTEAPESFDWRDQGGVNPVKNQEQCGSCWAFCTVANIEGVYYNQHGELPNLSEQELVSCDTNDNGCNGGLPAYAAEFLIENEVGLESEGDYPYEAEKEKCVAKEALEQVFVTDYRQVMEEGDMAAALVQFGPLSIGLNADPLGYYWGGIINPEDPEDCSASGIDHGVAIVGYGEDDGTPYWTVRNSWSADWGEAGYFRIVRGKGACGLDQMVTTVTETKPKSKKPKTKVFFA